MLNTPIISQLSTMEEEQPLEGKLLEEQKRKSRQEALLSEHNDLFTLINGGLLEIGCGHGHWLTAYAQTHPEDYCVGLDIIQKRIRKSQKKAENRNLTNIRFIKAEAIEFIELLPEETVIEKVVILFPDPWPKKRHHRRRLIQDQFLTLMASKMAAHGKIYFRTDFDPYFEWATEEINQHPQWSIDKQLNWPMEQSTYFQELMTGYQSLSATVVSH